MASFNRHRQYVKVRLNSGLMMTLTFALWALWMNFANANPPFGEIVQGVTVDVTPSHVYIPQGFDNNDLHVQLVIEGELPNRCYDIDDVPPQIDPNTHRIYLHQTATYNSGNSWCEDDVPRPYLREVDLKKIPQAGNYEVFITNSEAAQPISVGVLPITATKNPNPDDYLYAPVLDAHVEKSSNYAVDPNELPIVVMQGAYKNSCMTLKEVKINVRPNNVIELLPIAERAKNAVCSQIRIPFDEPIAIPRVPKGRYLIHIRSLSGHSVNKVLDL